MMGEVNAAIESVDIVALLLDASEAFGVGDRRAVERVERFEGTRFLLLNKIDRVPKTELLPRSTHSRKTENSRKLFRFPR